MPIQTRVLIIFGLFSIVGMVYGATLQQPGFIKSDRVNFRTGPAFNSSVIAILQKGMQVSIMEESDLWYKAQLPDGKTGWIHRQYIELEQPVPAAAAEQSIPPVDRMLAYAKSLAGVKYIYGGQSPQGFDCSGFTMYVFAKLGIRLPHQSNLQMEAGVEVSDRNHLLPGDLVFFKTLGSKTVNHVGIYLGDNRFIHASSGYGAVRVSPLDSGYYNKCYTGGRRLINQEFEESTLS